MPRPSELARRLALAWLLLTLAAVFAGASIASVFVPLIDLGVDWLQDDYVARVAVVEDPEGGWLAVDELQMQGVRMRPVLLAPGRTVPAGAEVAAAVHVSHVLVPVVITLSLVFAWPMRDGGTRAVSLITALLALALVQAATVPVMLVGVTDIQVLEAALAAGVEDAPEPWRLSWLLFVENGGRWALSLGAAALAIGAGEAAARLSRRSALAVGQVRHPSRGSGAKGGAARRGRRRR